MDELDAFFRSSQRPVTLPGPISSRPSPHPTTASTFDLDSGTSATLGTEYVENVVAAENALRRANHFREDDQTDESEEILQLKEHTNVVYNKYSFAQKEPSGLPIDELKSQILDNLESQNVTIVEGPTGCGKTTQIPQWILNDCRNKRRHCNIVVTQPRRIAAICVARRVASEHNSELGQLIGYQIGLDKKTSSDTRLQYVTTGVLLHQIVTKKSLRLYTHIVLDEVHERNKDMDLLLIIIRKLLMTNSKNVKLVLMSATFNTIRFAEYFGIKTRSNITNNTIISIPNQNSYQVKIYYIEQLTKLGLIPEIDYDNPKISKKLFEFTVKLLNAFEKIDIIEEAHKEQDDRRSCVLVFLPGLSEIEDLYHILNSDTLRKEIDPTSPLHKWWLIPLHSIINTEEQIKAFQKPPAGYRKIILATNIAESSITVMDIKYVIDFCLTKMVICNPQTNFSSLQLCWASHANCRQRAGRAGRVRSGKVYRLVSSNFYDSLPLECSPEMQRSNLENLILHAKLVDMGPPKYLLALAMDPPDLSNIQRTILALKEVGALFKTVSGEYSMEDGDISYLGKIMSLLPLDTRVSKLIIFGYIFGCLKESIIIGAAVSTKNIFSNPFLDKMGSYDSKLAWAHGTTSDCIAFLNVYNVYESLLRQNKFAATGGQKEWAKTSFVQLKSLRELHKLVQEIKGRLSNENISETRKLWSPTELPTILRIIIAGAFYPNYFCFSNVLENDGREATKILNGRDPYNTVYLTNMDNKQPGALYSSQIKEIFMDCSKRRGAIVDFDHNSRKIFVTFPSSRYANENANIPGKVSMSVYKAIKMRQLKIPIELKVMTLEKSLERASQLGLFTHNQVFRTDEFPKPPVIPLPKNLPNRLPGIDENYIAITITGYRTCGHFWAKIEDNATKNEFQKLSNALNSRKHLIPLNSAPVIGEIYVALIVSHQRNNYFRVRVENMLADNSVCVFLIDIGKNCSVAMKDLLSIKLGASEILKIPPFAFECILAEISPSVSKDPRGVWTDAANSRFLELTKNKVLYGKIFSVVFSIVSLELFDQNISINDLLVLEGHAQVTEESYASKLNRDLRERVFEMHPSEILIHNNQQAIQNMPTISKIVAPDLKECTQKIHLKGPFSPLETTVHSLFHSVTCKGVFIESDSVNSILLNTDFHCQTERMIVAANVGENPSGNIYTLRNTTLMPNIPGLTAIISLIFCPTAELRVDTSSSCYVAALCGLGHINGKPIFPEHDIVVNINAEITDNDLKNINFIRHIINSILMTTEDGEAPILSDNLKKNNLTHIKTTLNELTNCHYRKQHNFSSNIDNWKWDSIPVENQIKLDPIFSDRELYPAIQGIKLNTKNDELLKKLAIENAKLREIAKRYVNLGDSTQMQCNLCGTGLLSVQSLRLHLYSRMHRDREKDLPTVEIK